MRLVLLMTASIDPKGCPDSRFSVEERRRMYVRAFKYYVKHLNDNDEDGYNAIIFAENSGADLSEFLGSVPTCLMNRVELFALNPADFDPSEGKGFNEAKMIDQIVDKSQLLWEEGHFVKVTGRYVVKSLASHIRDVRRCMPNLDLYCDVKDHTIWSRLKLNWTEKWCDTRCFCARVAFYRKYLYGRYHEIGRKYWAIEQQYFWLTRELRDTKTLKCRFSRPISIDGLNGSVTYFHGIRIPTWLDLLFFAVKDASKIIQRKIFPDLWM